MGISGISAYSGIFNVQRSGFVTYATAKLAQDTPVEPVPRVTNEASGNASVAAAGSSDARPQGRILSGADGDFARILEEYVGYGTSDEPVDVYDIINDMKAGSKWAIELSEPEDIVNSVAEDVAELVYEQNFKIPEDNLDYNTWEYGRQDIDTSSQEIY